jgi:hypothetical protein
MLDRRNVYRVLAGKPEGKRLLRKLRHNWKDNIKKSSRNGMGARTGLDCLRTGIGVGFL